MNAPAKKQQWRVIYEGRHGAGVCFVDAPTEREAREFFAQAFPRAIASSVTLESVNPCVSYEKRPT